ncbi:MAG: SGNH/GDSL hydrolase family protein [Candidatus Paceibacterota bacterium]
MKYLILVPSLLLLTIVCYYVVTLYQKIQISTKLVQKAEPFRLMSADDSVTVLVLGDSTAVGVGADEPALSVAGRLANHLDATFVENLSQSGAKSEDLKGQISSASKDSYKYILIQIGGNDIISFKSATKAAEELTDAVKTLPATENLIVLSAGNVGGGTFFPHFLRPLYTKINLAYHKSFARVVEEAGGTYVNLYVEPAKDPFVLQPERYLALDGLHPSSEGYRVWFRRVLEEIE